MAISSTLRSYLKRCGSHFEQLPHERTFDMQRAAHAAHVSGNRVAKGVMVKAGEHFLLAVLPASRKVNLSRLRKWLGRDVGLATEAEVATKFFDCEIGAIPPVGAAYGLDSVIDDDLFDDDEIYFEGGDHRTLIAMEGADWRRMISKARHYGFGKSAS